MQSRLALVIGNGAYRSAPLNNPMNDAQDVANALRELDFEVIEKIDSNKREMVDAINTFGRRLKHADIGVFYFAGHGMQIRGRNFLIPVGARVGSESDVEFESVDAGRVLGKMAEAENRLNLVILDACRDNPFVRSFRNEQRGLARMDAPVGSVIAYSTSPGSVAADGQGRNGIFTKHLLKNIKRPELDVHDIFTETGLAVMEETGRRQVPWISSTPIPRFYLAGGGPVAGKHSGGRTDPSTKKPDKPAGSGPKIKNNSSMSNLSLDCDVMRFGICISDLDPLQHDVMTTKGVLVAAVEPGTVGDKADIRPGDIIQQVNHHTIITVADYRKAIARVHKGESFRLFILRPESGFLVRQFTEQ